MAALLFKYRSFEVTVQTITVSLPFLNGVSESFDWGRYSSTEPAGRPEVNGCQAVIGWS